MFEVQFELHFSNESKSSNDGGLDLGIPFPRFPDVPGLVANKWFNIDDVDSVSQNRILKPIRPVSINYISFERMYVRIK